MYRVAGLALAGAALCLHGCGGGGSPSTDKTCEQPVREPDETGWLPHTIDCGGGCTQSAWCNEDEHLCYDTYGCPSSDAEPCYCPWTTSVNCDFFNALFGDECLTNCDDVSICCHHFAATDIDKELCVATHNECYFNCTGSGGNEGGDSNFTHNGTCEMPTREDTATTYLPHIINCPAPAGCVHSIWCVDDFPCVDSWNCEDDYNCSCPATSAVNCDFYNAVFTDPCLIACDDTSVCCHSETADATGDDLCVAAHTECYGNCNSTSSQQREAHAQAHAELLATRSGTKTKAAEATGIAAADVPMQQRKDFMMALWENQKLVV